MLEWILKHKSDTTIEEVTDEILADLIENHEYVAVYFRGNECDDDEEDEKNDQNEEDQEEDSKVDCEQVLAQLETIDDELDEIGVILVTTSDGQMAKDHGILLQLFCRITYDWDI